MCSFNWRLVLAWMLPAPVVGHCWLGSRSYSSFLGHHLNHISNLRRLETGQWIRSKCRLLHGSNDCWGCKILMVHIVQFQLSMSLYAWYVWYVWYVWYDWFSFCTVSSWFCVVICCCVVVNCCCVVASCCCCCSFSELISSLVSSSCCLSLSWSCVCRLVNISHACMFAVCMSASLFFFCTAAFWVVLWASVFCSLSVMLCLVVGFEVCVSECFCYFSLGSSSSSSSDDAWLVSTSSVMRCCKSCLLSVMKVQYIAQIKSSEDILSEYKTK